MKHAIAALTVALATTYPAVAAPRTHAMELGDPYIGCVASKAAVAMRTYQHCPGNVCITAATTLAVKGCEKLWPKHLSKDERASLTSEANALMASITGDVQPSPDE